MTGRTTKGLAPHVQLLLWISKLSLSNNEKNHVERLCSTVDDWDGLLRIARERFASPILYHHLSGSFAHLVPEATLAQLRGDMLAFTCHSMALTNALVTLTERFLEPERIPYATFKGPALAAEFYGSIALRPFRDVDIIVPKGVPRLRLIEWALAEGFWLDKTDDVGSVSPLDHRAHEYFEDVVRLRSPTGATIEIHHTFDYTNAFYQRFDWTTCGLRRVKVGSGQVMTLPSHVHFAYLCYHHTRHRWSQLHWVSDLEIVRRHPNLDWEATYDHAQCTGLLPTVLASVAMARRLASERGEQEPPSCLKQIHPEQEKAIVDVRGAELFSDYVGGLCGGRESEFAYRHDNVTKDVGYVWQKKLTLIHRLPRYVWVRLLRIKPDYNDYTKFRLPPWLWPVYWLIRAGRLVVDFIGRRSP